jgi:hypothetical protein
MFRYGLLTMAKRGQETTHERNNTTPAGVPPCSNNINKMFSEASSPTIFYDYVFRRFANTCFIASARTPQRTGLARGRETTFEHF